MNFALNFPKYADQKKNSISGDPIFLMSLCVGRYIYFSMERSSHFDAQMMSTASAGEGGSSDSIEGPVNPGSV